MRKREWRRTVLSAYNLHHLYLTRRGGPGMARRNPPRKVTYFEPVPPRFARNTILETTFAVGRHFRCTMRVDCGQIDPGTVIQPVLGEWQPHIPAPSTRRSSPTGKPAAMRSISSLR